MNKLILSLSAIFLALHVQAQEELFQNLSQFGIGSSLQDGGSAIAYDQNQDIVIIGTFNDDMDFEPGTSENIIDPLGEPDIFIAKYQSSGTLLWGFNLGRIALSNGMEANGLAIGPENNILVSGSFSNTVDFDPSDNIETRTSSGGKDAFMAVYSSDGTFIRVETFGSIFYEIGDILEVDNNGNTYFSMRYNGDVDVDPGTGEVLLTPQAGAADAVLVKYNAAGEYQWHYAVSTPNTDKITAITVATNGTIGVGSTINGSLTGFGEHDMQLTMLNPDGSEMWSHNFDNFEKSNAIKEIKFADDNTNVFVIGRIDGTTDFDPSEGAEFIVDPLFADPFIAKYIVETGDLIWINAIRSAGTRDFATGITEAGIAVIVTGSFDISATFESGNFNTLIPSAGGSDIYMAAYNRTDGSYIDAKTFGAEGDEVAVATQFLAAGNMAMIGDFENSIQLNPDNNSIASQGFNDIFFAEFSFQTNVSDGLTPVETAQTVSVYPVPASNMLYLDVANFKNAESVQVKVFNVVGQVVKSHTFNFSSGVRQLDLIDLKSGVYIIEFNSGIQRVSRRFVKR